MPGGPHEGAVRRRKAGERAGVTLTVYHATTDVDEHVAALRRDRRFRLACLPQRAASARALADADVVLWELAQGRKPDRRQIQAMARRAPVFSYSADAGRELAEVSRAAGFASHLKAPLRPVDVEHQLALVAPSDLSTRLRQFQSTLCRHLARSDVLMEFAQAVNASLDPQRVAEALVTRSASWLPVPTVALVVADTQGSVRLIGGRNVADHERTVTAVGAWVVRHGRGFAAPDLSATAVTEEAPAVAGFALPLAARGRTVGALVALDARRAARSPRLAGPVAAVFGPVLDLAALALDNALRLERAAALTVTDDLTQLYNARYLGQVLRREAKRASRSGRPLSLLFIDLDGFKGINDAYGHLNGSRALVEAAVVIRDSARETDMAARFGGDEFTIVLPETGGEGAVAVAERVRERIAAHEFLAGEGLNARLTASVGVATLPDVAASASGLLQAADQAMYRVKDRGKNGIWVAGTTE